VRLEGTLDGFGLADILQLLSTTNKTGALPLRRGDAHGAVHLREGAVCGARSDVGRQALSRRLIGAGLVDDAALGLAIEKVVGEPSLGLGRALVDAGALDEALVREVAAEQATDAVFDLLRWLDGDFTFTAEEIDPDELGLSLPVEQVVAEARRRLESWSALTAVVPSPATVLSLAPCPSGETSATRREWALLSLVDGVRPVSELVALSGRGEYVVVGDLAGLVERGLLTADDPGGSAVVRRQQLLAALEGRLLPLLPPLPREPDHRLEAAPAEAGAGKGAVVSWIPAGPSEAVGSGSAVSGVHSAHALAPEPLALVPRQASPQRDIDPHLNQALLLRLIAGVRGL